MPEKKCRHGSMVTRQAARIGQAYSCQSGRSSERSKQGYQNCPSREAPNHHRNAECRRAALTPYLLPGERLLHLRPRRIICRSRPLRTRKSTTAAKCCSGVQAATLTQWMFTALRLCRCGLHCTFGTRFSSKRRAASLFFLLCRLDIGGGRPSCQAVGCWRYRGTFRTGCCLVDRLVYSIWHRGSGVSCLL